MAAAPRQDEVFVEALKTAREARTIPIRVSFSRSARVSMQVKVQGQGRVTIPALARPSSHP
jgi:hypothetical protein